jgi:hypothetical protein
MEGRRNGLTPIEVYSNLEEGQGLQGAEGDLKTRITTPATIPLIYHAIRKYAITSCSIQLTVNPETYHSSFS